MEPRFQPFDSPEFVYCDICGRKIFEGDPRYRMPDGKEVCDDILCLEEWMEEYKRYA